MKLTPVIDDTDQKILDLLCQGFAPKEIAGKLWKSKGSIHQRMHVLRKFFHCRTTFEMIAQHAKKSA